MYRPWPKRCTYNNCVVLLSSVIASWRQKAAWRWCERMMRYSCIISFKIWNKSSIALENVKVMLFLQYCDPPTPLRHTQIVRFFEIHTFQYVINQPYLNLTHSSISDYLFFLLFWSAALDARLYINEFFQQITMYPPLC